MLETLTGPFTIVDLANNPVVSGTAIANYFYYDDDVGLIHSSDAFTLDATYVWVVQLDGTACIRSHFHNHGRLIPDLHNSRRPNEYGLIQGLATNFYAYNKFTGTREQLIATNTSFGDIQIRLNDRYLFVNPGTRVVRWIPLDFSAPSASEFTLTGVPINLVNPHWSRTRHSDVMAVAFATGHIIYYNYVTKTQLPQISNIGVNKGAWYSLRHNIWIKINSSNQLVIHAATPRPFAMTAPTGGAATRGRVTSFSVAVTGDAGEPCPDELITWSLTGGSIGQLKATQSKTNQSGVASIDYVAPIIGALGNATIRAELKF